MPTYEYECQNCGNRFELFQSMSEEPIKKCPKCQGNVKRLIGTGSGIIYKGAGFYTTEYRSESYKKGEKAEKEQKKGKKEKKETKKKD